MTRFLLPAAMLTTSLLAGCGSATGTDAVDPTTSSPSPTSSPSAPARIGEHPAYPHADYSYDLEVQCFCPSVGQPVHLTVEGGEVVDAVWMKKGSGHAKGDQAQDEWLRLTINDILTEAADDRWDQVDITWPDGQDHPSRVAIDRMKNAMDDETTYLISDVQVSP